MNWEKKGILIEPQSDLWWMKSHAMLPTVDQLQGDLYRVYFSGRDTENRSQIGFAVVRVREGSIQIEEIANEPVLGPGERGCFDDNGVTPSWVVSKGSKKFLYYIGWNSGTSTIRMSLIAGLAISNDNGKTFQRHSRAPLLHKTDREPFSIMTAPCVLREGEQWHLYYVSGEGWRDKDTPLYNIKYAASQDGIRWSQAGKVMVELRENETALARPCVMHDAGLYCMWFGYKDPAVGYRIGYASSVDGQNWDRRDNEAGIDVSPSGWDSEMIEYAYVFKHKDRHYMLYNGNAYGGNGAGYAVLNPS